MKSIIYLFMLFILTVSCKQGDRKSEYQRSSEITVESYLKENADTKSIENENLLVLSANSLQVVNVSTGSTSELPIGMKMEDLTLIIRKVLNTEIPKSVISQCGEGPMTILAIENGLNLMFQNSKNDDSGDMRFVGWSLIGRDTLDPKITTMTGIGIGSSLLDLEDVYVVKISTTSKGKEFTIGDQIFGILNSRDEIEIMWSGISCNFL